MAGQRADPAGDQVVAPAGAPSGLDLSGASVRYDSAAGELRITYRGTITVASHSRTAYDGVIAQTSSSGGCGATAAGDATFSGSTLDASGGGDPRGTAHLDLATGGAIDGVVQFPADGSVVFAFASPLLQNRAYRCASALRAQWMNSNPFTSVDEVAPFDLAVVPDPGTAGAGAGAASTTNEAVSAVATGGPREREPAPPPARHRLRLRRPDRAGGRDPGGPSRTAGPGARGSGHLLRRMRGARARDHRERRRRPGLGRPPPRGPGEAAPSGR